LYVLGYDEKSNLTPINRAVKENLKTYLNEYRMLTDGVNIIDGFVINIGIDFEWIPPMRCTHRLFHVKTQF
jgi:hypothetical protein